MRNITISLITIILLLSLFSCKRSEGPGPEEKEERAGESHYLIEDGSWGYLHEEDIGKKLKDVTWKIKLEFGDEVELAGEKEIGGESYARVKVKDDEYWVKRAGLAEELVVVTGDKIVTYLQADSAYPAELTLEPGELGIFIKEVAGFRQYRIVNFRKGSNKAVGPVWIDAKEKGLTRERGVVKEAYYLSQAGYYLEVEKGDDLTMVNYFINKGLRVSKLSGKRSFVTEKLEEFAGSN